MLRGRGFENAKSVWEWKMVPGENRLLVIGRKMFYYRCIVGFSSWLWEVVWYIIYCKMAGE